MTGVARKRYVEGLWVGSEGLVYDRWDESKYVCDSLPESFDRVWVGCDEGYNHPSVQLLCGLKDDIFYVMDEWCERHKLEQQVVEHAEYWKREYPEIECFVVDPSAAKLRAAMRHAGLDVTPADNAVFSGIQSVSARMSNDPSGKPRLQVHRQCSNLLREFSSYEWASRQDGTLLEKPVKLNDDCVDSLRYSVTYTDGLKTAPSIRSIGGVDDKYKMNPLENEQLWTEI